MAGIVVQPHVGEVLVDRVERPVGDEAPTVECVHVDAGGRGVGDDRDVERVERLGLAGEHRRAEQQLLVVG